MNLSSTIKSIQDIMRKDDGVDGDAQRLGQLTWMLFLKVFDQREEEWEDDNPKYRSPSPVNTAGATGPPMCQAWTARKCRRGPEWPSSISSITICFPH
ncbi:type I restriction-modification system subunit M N-terminal domain-containing protein [Microbulbifer taiwanensis]|uniref:type I restriction-modification system subunit M N-terminal domain-containing protein n=1 Tax=Microbulbifer taiwanensis TaxID=986746 RepID=UPI00360976AC